MSNSMSSGPTVVFQPSHATVQAVATACAMIASADGQVSNKERRCFLRFLRQQGVLQRYGRASCMAEFNRAVRSVSSLTLEEICDAADQFSAVSGAHGAPMVVRAAAYVALADGVTWPQEIALLEVIRNRTGLGYPPGWNNR